MGGQNGKRRDEKEESKEDDGGTEGTNLEK